MTRSVIGKGVTKIKRLSILLEIEHEGCVMVETTPDQQSAIFKHLAMSCDDGIPVAKLSKRPGHVFSGQVVKLQTREG